MKAQMRRYNKDGSLATEIVDNPKEVMEHVLYYLSYDLMCHCVVNYTPVGKKEVVVKYEGEAGLIQVKIELGLIPDEDLLGYLHTNEAINALIADRLGVMV
jgi:hypothetical protein